MQSVAFNLVKPKVVADAEFVGQQLKKLFPQLNPYVIKNGIDTEKFVPGDQIAARQSLALPLDKTLVGCAGRLEPVKGQRYLINALQRLDPKIHLVVAGHGSQQQPLKQLSQQLNMANRVHFLGLCEEMPRFYQALDLFCLPSLCEGFPLSPLEAQACNTPVLVTNVGGAKETACPVTSGVVKAGRTFALQHKIEAMLSQQMDSQQTVSRQADSQQPREFILHNNSLTTMSAAYRALSFNV